ncbi:D-2-hydroxyacid dehydrogenase [Candidatus Latescibacterota bacterium]
MLSLPRIVVLDGYTLNPGDLSGENLESLGKLTIHDRSAPDEVLGRSTGADILLTNKTVLDRPTIMVLPELKYIGVLATGYNIVDLAAADERGIPVTNVPEYGTASVAQMTFALILELVLQVGYHAETVRDGRWAAHPDFCYWDRPLIELAGMILGIVGFGRIGSAVARIARSFGMTVIAYDINLLAESEAGVSFVPLDEVFRRADIVTLHCPLTEENTGMVNADRLALMKPAAYLINTSRGPLVVERDLADALNRGTIAGAGLDVLSVEPPRDANPLIGAGNCFITPHISWATSSARKRLMETVVGNIRAFLAGNPVNVVNRSQ